MNDSIKIPMWFKVVAVLAILWEVMGVWAYMNTMTMSAEGIMQMPEAQRAIHNATPSWANGAFAVAVFGGLIGSLLLLLKKSLALPVLIASLLAVLVQMYNAFLLMDSYAVFGPGVIIMPIMVITIALLLVWLAHFASGKGWLK